MRLPGRFEWKVLLSVWFVTIIGLIPAALGLRHILDGVAAYAGERQARFTGAAQEAMDLFRDHFAQEKRRFRTRTAFLAGHLPSQLSSLAGEAGLLEARLLDGDEEGAQVLDRWVAPAAVESVGSRPRLK